MTDRSARASRQLAQQFLVRRARAAGGPVLELFAGGGELTRALADAGTEVTGVEPQEPPTRVAELARESRVEMLKAEPRALRLPRRFGLVLTVGAALRRPGNPDDLEAVFATAAAHLTEKGTYLLEMEGLSTRLQPRERAVFDPRSGATTGMRGNPSPARALHAPHLARRGAGREAVSRLSLLALAPNELIERLEAVGLKPLETYGDWDERPFDLDSPRLICVSGLATSN